MTNQKGSFADLIRDCESLLEACDANAAYLYGLELVRDPLAQTLETVKTLKGTQETSQGKRQVTTQYLKEECERAREAARRVRGFVKSRLGTKSELLTQFGIMPIRTRLRKRAEPPGTEAAQPGEVTPATT
jgi:hypothetical protein